MELLARFRLPEYWLIDPIARSLEVYVNRRDARLMPTGTYEAGQAFISPTLKELGFDVARLFED